MSSWTPDWCPHACVQLEGNSILSWNKPHYIRLCRYADKYISLLACVQLSSWMGNVDERWSELMCWFSNRKMTWITWLILVSCSFFIKSGCGLLHFYWSVEIICLSLISSPFIPFLDDKMSYTKCWLIGPVGYNVPVPLSMRYWFFILFVVFDSLSFRLY